MPEHVNESSGVRAVIGTAGHVDHGKTTMVRHLSGIDTDRLKEEKSRGISIELGFAWLDLDEGRVAIIDVPGHERFVRQMIAGAAGIDLVLLVVAADEGVMPQTREHLDICQLLGVRAGAIVITKTDLVDEEWLELVREDVADGVAGTFLDGAPILTYAAGDDEAASAVKAGIEALIRDADQRGLLAARAVDRPFKLSADRVFSMRGFGTVVTGTSASGQLAVSEPVSVLPGGAQGRVRGLQVHEQAVDRVGPGMRVAINIQGVDREDIERGAVICGRPSLISTSMFDGTFTAISRLTEPVEDRSRVLVHVGTAQIQGTLALLGVSRAEPGETVPVQVRLDHPTAILPGEPYVVRGFTPLEGYGKTLGGGRALTPQHRRHKGKAEPGRRLIAALSGEEPDAMLEALLVFEGEQGFERADLDRRLPLGRETIEATAARLLESGRIVRVADRLFALPPLDALATAARRQLDAYHRANRARPGMPPEELRSRVRASLPTDVFAAIVERMVDAGAVVRRGDLLARPDFEPSLSQRQKDNCTAVFAELEREGLTPARLQDLPEVLGLPPSEVQEAVELLQEDGRLVRVSRDFIFAADHLARLRKELVAYLEQNGSIDTAAFKAMTGATRKWTIPLGEYFDRIRLTLRVGDSRRLRQVVE